jgi:hypothetical protein
MKATTDVFRVLLGNTDRSAKEVISHLHHTVSMLAGIHIESAKNTRPDVGQLLLDFYLPAQVTEVELQQALNESGGCMFQVDSVTKVPAAH